MANLGVFRDEFYNAIHVLSKGTAATGLSATGTLTAAMLSGAQVCFTNISGTSQTFTTDSAANIIANVQQAVGAALKANVGGFAAALGGVPAVAGLPNFFNLSWIVEVAYNITTGGTLAYGTGVTASSVNSLSTTATPTGTGVMKFIVTITGPASVNFQRVQ